MTLEQFWRVTFPTEIGTIALDFRSIRTDLPVRTNALTMLFDAQELWLRLWGQAACTGS